jgi:hypothetical protein
LILNSFTLGSLTLTAGTLPAGSGLPARLELGVPDCGGCSTGIGLEYRDWKFSGDADSDLGI